MDKISYRNPSKLEIIGRCGGDEKPRKTTQNHKSRTLKNTQENNNPEWDDVYRFQMRNKYLTFRNRTA